MKKRLDLRIEAELRDGLDLRVDHTGQQLTAIVERYIRDGLTRDAGELVELNSLPAIRIAVREETNKAISQLYQQFAADLAKSAKKSDERLAKLGASGARNSGVAYRMVFSLIDRLVNREFALKALNDAKEKAAKALKNEEEP
jgi:hypothetical protein